MSLMRERVHHTLCSMHTFKGEGLLLHLIIKVAILQMKEIPVRTDTCQTIFVINSSKNESLPERIDGNRVKWQGLNKLKYFNYYMSGISYNSTFITAKIKQESLPYCVDKKVQGQYCFQH